MPAMLWMLLVLAQDGPLDGAARNLGRRGLSEAAAPELSPTRFRPSGSRVAVEAFVRAYLDDPEERDAIAANLRRSLDAYEEAVAGTPAQADASAALAYAVTVLWSTAGGTEADAASYRALFERLRASFDTPELRAVDDLQKQRLYERALCAAGLVQVVAGAVDDPARLRDLARRELRALVGAEVERVRLDGPRVSIRGTEPEAKPAVEAPAPAVAGLAPGFTFRPPPGWSTEAGWHIFREKHAESATAACVRLPAPRPATANVGAALQELWRAEAPKELAGRHGTMVYRRRIGQGLLDYFICGVGREGGRKADTLVSVHLIVCGAQWQPLVVALTVDPPEERPPLEAYAAAGERAEGLLASFRCPGGAGRGFVSRDSLLGDYGFGRRAGLDGVSTGALEEAEDEAGGTLSLRKDGEYVYEFQGDADAAEELGVFAGSDQGRWTLEDDLLVLRPPSGTPRRYRLAGLTQFTSGPKVAVLLSRVEPAPHAALLGRRSDLFSTAIK